MQIQLYRQLEILNFLKKESKEKKEADEKKEERDKSEKAKEIQKEEIKELREENGILRQRIEELEGKQKTKEVPSFVKPV